MSHRNDLEGEAQPVVITAPGRDQSPILVVQVEEPFQLDPRVHTKPAVATFIVHTRHEITNTPTHWAFSA
jgi:hypothetical protein